MATQTFKNFKIHAGLLESELGIKYDAKPYKETIRTMLDGYCKAMDDGDEYAKTLYISGLMLRFWDKVGKLERSCPNIGMKGDDFVDWVYDAIALACDYRKWQKDESVNAQQCINQCIETIRVRRYYDLNLDKNKANYMSVSMETPICDENDNGTQKTLGDTMVDEDAIRKSEMASGADAARRLVQSFINDNQVIEAIVMDVIAFGDATRHVKHVEKYEDEDGNSHKYIKYTSEFWRFKAVKILSNLPEDYSEYFVDNYEVKADMLAASLDFIGKLSSGKLYKQLDKSLSAAKTKMMAADRRTSVCG